MKNLLSTKVLPRLQRVPRFYLKYDRDEHEGWPHVVKFSGGRSSALMMLGLLYAKQLRPSRGDVIIFNNTSAEHPATYRFAAICKRIAEERFNIPFFWTEFQTFEDARRGQWARIADYRMVQADPYGRERLDGYRSNGEVFEELVSWKQALPTRFARHCTEFLKLNTTARFLEDWFGRPKESESKRRQSTRRLGHWYVKSRMKPASYGEREKIVRYHMAMPTSRPRQVFQDFTSARLTELRNPSLSARTFDSMAQLKGDDAVEFLSLVGLRDDEPHRVARVLERNNALRDQSRLADGEYVYAPLYDDDVGKEDVLEFWSRQSWDLEIPIGVNLSNCVYCFMKGERALRNIAAHCESIGEPCKTGPGSIEWWADLERQYARAVPSRADSNCLTRFGFFGANRLQYTEIVDTVNRPPLQSATEGALPCECTD